jgi:xanthine dehydrogenase accessory factor
MNVYTELINILNTGRKAATITTFENRNVTLYKNITLISEEELISKDISSSNMTNFDKVSSSLESGTLQFIENTETQTATLIEPYFPEPRLIIFGGGHIARPLVEFASRVGFHITLIDDRPSFANAARFPSAEKVICESFEKSFQQLEFNKASYVVIITRGHRHDMLCLKEALKYETAYLGMIGSKRRTNIIKQELFEDGYSQTSIDNINAPIGLDIAAVSPEEIAISIVAQLISYRRGNSKAKDGLSPKKTNHPEFDPIVINELAKETAEPKALVTIVATKGSVPRKAGAKMLVYSDGRTLGSIGGGCSEGEVIILARYIIKNGGYLIHHIDMTGEVAEDEGMVCGGVMTVLIEAI